MDDELERAPLHYCTIGQESAESAEVKCTSQKKIKKSLGGCNEI